MFKSDNKYFGLLILFSLIYFGKAFSVYFGVDDFRLYSGANYWDVNIVQLKDLFASRFASEKLAFFLSKNTFGKQVFYYHIVSYLLHIAASFLVFEWVKSLKIRPASIQYIAPVLFLFNPGSYTIISWAALGYNEPPVAILTLLGMLAVVRFLRASEKLYATLALSCIVLAASFKNQAVYIPFFYSAIPIILYSSSLNFFFQRMKTLSIVTFYVFCFSFCLWYVLYVVPYTPSANHPAYKLDWSLGTLMEGYSQILYAAINPFPFFRDALGYQQAVPQNFPFIDQKYWIWCRNIFTSGLLLFSLRNAFKFGLAKIWVTLFCLGLLAMSFAAAMPHHRYEYYSYLAMIPLSLCFSYLYIDLDKIFKRNKSIMLAIVSVLSLVGGLILYQSNIFISQARNAELGIILANQLNNDARIHFINLKQADIQDQDRGTNISSVVPEKPISMSFSTEVQSPFHTTSWPQEVLAYFDSRGTKSRLVVLSASNQTAESAVDLYNKKIVQTFYFNTVEEISEIGFLVGTYNRTNNCTLNAEIYTRNPVRFLIKSKKFKCQDLIDNSMISINLDKKMQKKFSQLQIELTIDAKNSSNSIAVWTHSSNASNFTIEENLGGVISYPKELAHYLGIFSIPEE